MIDLNTQFRDFPDMLTPPDITKMLNISKTSTYRLLSENIIPSIRLGRVYRIPKAYVLQYILSTELRSSSRSQEVDIR